MKKLLSVVLSICMVLISVPVFANSSNEVKVQLSDQAMAEAVGGTGTVQTQIVKNTGGNVQALIVNAANFNGCTYTVTKNMDISGNGGVVAATGTLNANTTILVPITATSNLYVRADLACSTSALKASTTAYVN